MLFFVIAASACWYDWLFRRLQIWCTFGWGVKHVIAGYPTVAWNSL